MNIAQIRRSRGLTQTDLADMTHLTQPTISRAERGDDSTTMATLTGIASALDVPLSELFISDRSAIEVELLRVFRQLSPDRQKGWLEMARVAMQDLAKPTQ
jgi:transcriptional regulator with XRE-family HTH domain